MNKKSSCGEYAKMKRKHNESVMSAKTPKEGNRSKYVGDPKLAPRITQYIQGLKNKKHVNLSLMAEELQKRYSEYSRKKKNSFRLLVERVYNSIQELDKEDGYSSFERKHLEKRQKTSSDDSENDSSDDSKSFSSDNMEYVKFDDTNSMNTFMTSMYKKNKSLVVGGAASSQPSSPRPRHLVTSGPKSMPASPQHRSSSPSSSVTSKPLYMIDRVGNRDKLKSTVKDTESLWEENASPAAKSEVVDLTSGPGTPEVTPKISDQEEKTDLPKENDQSKKTPGKRVLKKSKVEKKKGPEVQQSTVKFADIGGNDKTLQEVCKLLVHMKHPEVYQQLGVTPPRGFLLHGPPGCGKTLLAHAIAGELELPFIKLAATEIVSGVSGESEEKVRDIFNKAVECAPCILFLDEIDSITQKRENASKDMERRIVSQLLTCMDDLNLKTSAHVLVIGATNRPDSLDPALRRAGRFDREISMGIPDEKARTRILEVLCRNLKLSEDINFLKLARLTPGFVGADLMALAREAAIIAVNRVFNSLQNSVLGTEAQSLEPSDTSQKESDSQLKSTKSTETATLLNVQPPQNKLLSSSTKDVESQDLSSTLKNSACDIEMKDSATSCPVSSSVIENLVAKTSNDDGNSATEVKDGTKCEQPLSMANIIPLPSHDLENNSDSEELNKFLRWLKDQPPLTEEQLQNLFISLDDFQEALKHVQPSAKREGFATVPDITWDDIGALKEIREELEMSIMAPVNHPEQFKSLGLLNPPGILLAGPPGCGKTLLAKAVANESGINFISVKGPELLNMYVGESEKAVRQVFQRARNSAPCVIFFDELDALCPKRSNSGDGGSSTRVVNQLLTEMDGLEERKQVFIMGATNRPDIIDPAIMRPGRLDKLLYVGLPNDMDKWEILKTITKDGTKPNMDESVNLKIIAADPRCQNFTGADLTALVREAAVGALREYMANKKSSAVVTLSVRHFDIAFRKVKPSVSDKDKLVYENMKKRMEVT